ncbi:hypothetical protein HZS_2908 [Henneguya salminicola]|nr:hypothetical protein HZS_2908 [Henneguya salminicola]
MCVCVSQFYTGQACEIQCKYFCRYDKCTYIKGKIVCECSRNFFNFFCSKTVYNRNDMILISAIVIFLTGLIFLLLLAGRLQDKKKQRILVKKYRIIPRNS